MDEMEELDVRDGAGASGLTVGTTCSPSLNASNVLSVTGTCVVKSLLNTRMNKRTDRKRMMAMASDMNKKMPTFEAEGQSRHIAYAMNSRAENRNKKKNTMFMYLIQR